MRSEDPLSVRFKTPPSPTSPSLPGYLWNSWRAATTLLESGCRSWGKAMSSFSWACSRATRGSSAVRAVRVAYGTQTKPEGRRRVSDWVTSVAGGSGLAWEKPVAQGRDWDLRKLSLCSPALGPDLRIGSHQARFFFNITDLSAVVSTRTSYK